jgi:cellulose synthase/poly-beta-1,6-N-acetylglucosamine synthase-like glycosyltransferase
MMGQISGIPAGYWIFLQKKNVRATFYVIGLNAITSPDLIKRIYDEGHDIGNHTLTHSHPLQISSERLAIEVNATTHIVKSLIGVRMHLFRPPYAAPGFSYLEARPEIVQTVSQLGYLMAEVGANSCDYCDAVSQEWAVSDILMKVLNEHRQVVLMHDSGGDRESTVVALPRLIDSLRAAGFDLVTTHELVGLPRTAVMEEAPPDAEASVWRVVIAIFDGIAAAIPAVAITTGVLGILRLLVIAILASIQTYRRRFAPQPAAYQGSIAVLVPAFNEEAVICKTVRCILSSTIADRLEVIVIDDGSTDATSEVVIQEFGDDPRVKVIRQDNGGKASALNWGLGCTSAKVIVTIDGDTVLLPDSIERLTARFRDPMVGAAAGNVRVGNQVNLITRFQALEYVTSQNLDRRAFELFNAIGVVPGAIGAWRREAMIQVGGYARDTLAEDAELTLAIQRHGWRIISEPSARALTEAPETLRAFMKQRYRWMFGTLQVAYKHAGSLLERPGGVSLITIPNIFLFQFAFTLLAPVMDAVLIWTVFGSAVSLFFETRSTDGGTLLLIAEYWLVFQAIDLSAAVLGIAFDREDSSWRLAALVLLQRFTYRQLLYVTAMRALLAALRGTFVGWGKLLRTGNVALARPKLAARTSGGRNVDFDSQSS